MAGFWKRFGGIGKTVLVTAASGAVAAVAAHEVRPDMQGDYSALGTVAAVGAGTALVTLLQRSPLNPKPPRRPRPQSPPES